MTGPDNKSAVLKELGRRLAARRLEAQLDLSTLAERAAVDADLLERFERGEGGLAAGALTRIATVLGISPAGLMSVSASEEKAPVAPSVLLLARGVMALGDMDRQMIDDAIRRSRAFIEVGKILAVESLCERFATVPAPGKDAHKDGYKLAQEVRGILSEYRGQPLRNLAHLIEDRFDILVVHRTFENASILGAASRSGQARVIIINSSLKHEAETRITLAHELCHHLKNLGVDGTTVDETTVDKKLDDNATFSLDTPPEEKRAKAFAAMLLAPDEALRRLLGPPAPIGHDLLPARQLVRKARHVFGLGFEAMAWHLFNRGYFKFRDTVLALLKAPDQDEVSGFEEKSNLDGLERRAQAALYGDLISEARYRELLGLPFDALLP